MLHFASAKALRADIHLLRAARYLDGNTLYVGVPDAIGSSMRMADIVSEMCAFTADLTLCHDNTSLPFSKKQMPMHSLTMPQQR
jgi:hypothetical protein